MTNCTDTDTDTETSHEYFRIATSKGWGTDSDNRVYVLEESGDELVRVGSTDTLARGEQALILMNRRGSANRIYCPACKSRITCPNCNVGLVVHSATGTTSTNVPKVTAPPPSGRMRSR